MEDLTSMCRGKTINSVSIQGLYGHIVFTDGSMLRGRGNGCEPEFVLAPKKEQYYRVIYYTVRGSMSKDFTGPDAETMANEFYNRHVKNHPEYQNCQWSRTSIIPMCR